MLLQISPPFSRSYTVKQGLTIVALDLITSLRAFRLFAVFTRSAFSSPQPNKPSDTLYSEDVGPLYRGRERSRRVCRPSAAAEGGRHAATGRDGQDVHQRVRETGGHARMPEMSSVSPWSFSGRFSWMGGEEGIARTKFGQHGGGCESGTCLDSRRCRVRHVDRGAGLLLTRSPKRLQHRTTSQSAPLIDFFPANEHHSIKDRGRADRDQADTFLFYPSLRLGVSGSFFCSQQCFASNCELASLPT